MRFFIALEIPEENKLELELLQKQIKALIPKSHPTNSEKLHLTVAFIGEQPEDFKQKLAEVLAQSVDGIKAFEVTPGYLDGFPTLHFPKVIWVGIKGDIDKLFILRERIKDGLVSLNLPSDERRFIPHIALIKVSNFQITPELEREFERITQKSFKPIKVSSIKLFESIPNHGLHQHNTLAEIKL
ncbi:RNA 2',3'-cyclic phosphodiesterase [Candidatus Daviesbacteria bacterium]|nr:RNA 2',3'-cyclic phosphodiesterase [Candidatus Daviesbacteria bacterium]